jgi:Tfp pilus assembly protein PilO
MNTNPPRKFVHSRILITVALGGAVLAYAFFVFLPTQKSIRELHTELQRKQMEIVQAERLVSTTVQTGRELAETREFIGRWRETTPTAKEVMGVFAQVTQGARDSGVKTVRFDPQPQRRYETVDKLPLEMEIQGAFNQVFDFVRCLESLEAPIWVEELTLEPASENSEKLQCELKMAVFAVRTDNSD